jgi:PD-(D/E)XK endonuclease
VDLTPTRKGALAEMAVMHRAFELGINVYRPVAEGARADMIFEVGPYLVRIQCKTGRVVKEAIVIAARSCRSKPDGSYVRETYGRDEVDAVAAYCPANGRCYVVPIDHVPPSGSMSLRLTPAKNNQLKGLHFAAEYELDHGAIAQLGERLHGMQEVAGSSPASSTPEEPRIARLFA